MRPTDLYAILPAAFRERVQRAIEEAFSGHVPTSLTRMDGGPSDALLLKLMVAGLTHVVKATVGASPLHDSKRQFARLAIASRLGVAPKLVLALILIVITSTNLIARKIDRIRAHGSPSNQPNGLGFAFGVRPKTHGLHQSVNDQGRTRSLKRSLPSPTVTMTV